MRIEKWELGIEVGKLGTAVVLLVFSQFVSVTSERNGMLRRDNGSRSRGSRHVAKVVVCETQNAGVAVVDFRSGER